MQEGKYNLEVSFLGYVPATIPVNVHSNIKNLHIELKENTLALDDVVVTAQAPKNELNTTLTIGNNALEHLQVSNVSDISALLPGGKTKVPDLTTNNIFSLRDGGSTVGNAAFGTAVEVDGVRIGNNGSFGNMNGADTRNITVADIESVEVITGVPSAEYGDLNSGMVKIHTRERENTLEHIIVHQSPHRTGFLLQRIGFRKRQRRYQHKRRMDKGYPKVGISLFVLYKKGILCRI